MSLLETLSIALHEKKALSFAEFMHLALYAPGEGYYSSGLVKLGRAGDFITSPELSPLFGYTLANQCQQVLSTMTKPILLEFGAGSGRLCIDVLTQLERAGSLPQAYWILEVSASLKKRQFDAIQEEIPHLSQRITWLDRWPKVPFNGLILANEVLDAMPVHRFKYTEQGIQESFIVFQEPDQLLEQFRPTQNDRLLKHIQEKLPQQEAPYLSEVNLFLDDWVLQLYQILGQGAVLLIDYGFPRHEYYHPDRAQGTLMCHYQHRAHTNPLIHIGEQDISAHVDFTHVAEAAVEAGFDVAGYTNQASFLLANGLLDFVDRFKEGSLAEYKARQAIKQLILPSEMGELFKVIALTKNSPVDLKGFTLNDKRMSL